MGPGTRVAAALAASVGGGLLLAGSLPPWPVARGAWPLGLLGAALLFLTTEDLGWRRRLAGGMAAGLGLYLPGLWWMRDFSLPGYVAATLLEAAILAGAVALVPPKGWRRAAAFPAALVLAETVRGAWPFGGLPISGIDLGQVDGPLAHATRIGGRLLLVVLVGMGGVALAALARRQWVLGAALAAAVVAVAGVGAVAPDGSVDGRLAVAAVQGGGPRGVRAVVRDPGPVFDRHVDATTDVQLPVDLVLWPEDVVDVERPVADAREGRRLSELARSLGATVVAGVVEDVEGGRFRNSAVAWGPDGTVVDRYEKVHRVPFGEYVPARSLFERLADLSAVPRDAIPGRGPAVLDTPAGRLGVAISYEVFFAHRARGAVRAGGRVLLVPTNASSYRDAQIPAQEVAVARLRAMETGRWVVQAAPTGYSAIVDQRGRVRAQGGLGGAEVLQGQVDLRTGQTFFVAMGSGPWVIAAGLTLLLCGRKLESLHSRFVDRRNRQLVE